MATGSTRNSGRLAAAFACGCLALVCLVCHLSTMEGAMNDATNEELRMRLERAAATGRLDGLEIEYWVGGGSPPPHYRSDQLRLFARGGRDVVEFARPLFDASFDPPDLVEKFTADAQPADVQGVARLVLAARLLDEAVQTGPSAGFDVLATEIAIAAGELRFERKHRGNELPESLRPLAQKIDELRQRLAKAGVRSVIHGGEPLNPPPPRR
jgi:hypothetical protein